MVPAKETKITQQNTQAYSTPLHTPHQNKSMQNHHRRQTPKKSTQNHLDKLTTNTTLSRKTPNNKT